MSSLRALITAGDVPAVRALIAASPELASRPFDDGATPLHVAAGEDQPDLVELLVAAGAASQLQYGHSAHSPLSWALTCWAYRAADRLVALGETPDLFCAAGLGDLARVQAFWRDGRLVAHPSRTGSTRITEQGDVLPSPPADERDQVSDALYLACRCDRIEAARWLVGHGADPNWRAYAGATCLAWAEFSGNADLCALLRAHGGSDATTDFVYRAVPKVFPLMVYAGWGFPKLLLERLTAEPALVHATGGRGTLLHAAAAGGQDATARILLAFGADRTATDPDGRTPAESASLAGHTAVAALLG